jgi:hypothetical protein
MQILRPHPRRIYRKIEEKIEMGEKTVKVGGYYYMRERLKSGDPTNWIIRIGGVGEKIPVAIYGLLINMKTGDIRVARRTGTQEAFWGDGSGEYVFACEVAKEVPEEELKKIKEALIKKISDFFEMPLDEFLKSYEPRK